MSVEDQGRGVLYSHIVIAEEYMRQNKIKPTDDNLKKTVMKLAKEKADSYTPSEELGKNPEGRNSSGIQEAYAPWLYGKDSVMNSLNLSATDKKALMVELDGALTHLIQIILKHVYGFRISRKAGANLSNPKELTSFEYVQEKGNSMTKEEREKYDALVAVNRQIRGMMRAYLVAAIIPLLNDTKENIYKKFMVVYESADTRLIKSHTVYKNIMKHLGRMFLINFSSTKISDYIDTFRVRPKGVLQITGKTQKKK